MSQPLLVVLVALAGFRLWRLLARDAILEPWREAVWTRFPPDERWAEHRARVLAVKRQMKTDVRDPSLVGVMLDCAWCAGWWICGLITVAAWQWCGMRYPLLVWPASSTLAGFMGRLDGLGG